MKASSTVRASLTAALLALCFLLTSCDLFAPKSASGSAEVGENGADLTVAGVRIVVPAGAAPAGTKIEAAFEDRDPEGIDGTNLKTLAKAFKIRLGDDLQPATPLTVTIPVDRSLLVDEQSEDTLTTVAMMVHSEGSSTPDLVAAKWDPAAGTLTAQVPHLSWLTPVQLDLTSLMRNVRDTIMQSLGIEYPKPACVDKPATVAGKMYTAISPAQAWLCVSETAGALTVTVSPNSPIPFMASSAPSSGATNRTEISVATAFSVAVANNLGFTRGSEAIMMPGADAQFRFEGAPAEVRLDFEQYPAMLLVAILARTLDIAVGKLGNAVHLDKVADAGCMENILNTSQAGSGLSPAVASGIVKSFFGCAGSAIELSFPAQIVLGILSAGPQFLVASALGIINEFTGGGTFSSTITATASKQGTLDGATRFVTMFPWTDGSLDLVSETYDGAGRSNAGCNGTEISGRKDTFRCYWPGVDDPCFQSPQKPSDFLCMASNHGKVNVRYLKNMSVGDKFGMFLGTGEPGKTSPLRVELTDGTLCTRSTGAGPVGVPGYPYWAGFCSGTRAGIWRVGEPDTWKNDPEHFALYPAVTAGGHWQVAISVGAEAAPAKRFDVKTVFR